MPRTTLVAGTTITASWANANVRDQVITPFASASARDSAISSPIEGQYAHLTDTNLLTHYDGAAWVPSNHNIVARQRLTASSSAFSGDVNTDFVLSSIPVKSSRLYKINLHSNWDLSAAATYLIEVTEDGTTIATFDVTDGDRDYCEGSALIEPTTGTKTYRIAVNEVVAGGTITFTAAATDPRMFWLEDVGPR